MPQLESGRHVAVGEPGLIEAVTQADETGALKAALIARTSILRAWDLLEVLPVIYFDETQGTPPDCPRYPSGFLVYEILEGRPNWSDGEVAEFRTWIESNAGLNRWLADYRVRLDDAIRESPWWTVDELEDLAS